MQSASYYSIKNEDIILTCMSNILKELAKDFFGTLGYILASKNNTALSYALE